MAKKYDCPSGGFTYDPEKGDPDGGIKEGVPFEQLPQDWECPICGSSKDMFEEAD
jgi:rubredoxin